MVDVSFVWCQVALTGDESGVSQENPARRNQPTLDEYVGQDTRYLSEEEEEDKGEEDEDDLDDIDQVKRVPM